MALAAVYREDPYRISTTSGDSNRALHSQDRCHPKFQSYITFTGAISANSQSIDAAKELMEVFKSPTAIGVMRSQGMEPGK